jgi:hypothetical protein
VSSFWKRITTPPKVLRNAMKSVTSKGLGALIGGAASFIPGLGPLVKKGQEMIFGKGGTGGGAAGGILGAVTSFFGGAKAGEQAGSPEKPANPVAMWGAVAAVGGFLWWLVKGKRRVL